MKKSLSFLIVGLIVLASAMFAADEIKELEVKIGGRVYQDWGWFSGDDNAIAAFGYDSGTEYRTARFSAEAIYWGHVKGKAEVDWSDGKVVFKDVYMELMGLPFNITVGHFKEPFSLEELTSSRFVTFMERASINQAFVPSRNAGLQFSANLADKMIYFAVGAFKEIGDFPNNLTVNGAEDLWAITARLAASPVYNEETKTVVHLGVAFSSRDFGDNATMRYRSRPETHMGNRLIDTHDITATAATLFGAEAAGVFGSFSVQGEYVSNSLDAPDSGDPVFSGYYIESSLWLTGENRNYKRSAAAFDRPKVKNLFLLQDGFGALQLAARYSNLNLNDGDIEGGKMNDFTIGLNWYPVDNARIMLNYIISDTDKFGSFNAFEVRFQYDWENKYSK
jgi:phosphate-selective porin OprO/OprP